MVNKCWKKITNYEYQSKVNDESIYYDVECRGNWKVVNINDQTGEKTLANTGLTKSQAKKYVNSYMKKHGGKC